jgi:hypothetical protein
MPFRGAERRDAAFDHDMGHPGLMRRLLQYKQRKLLTAETDTKLLSNDFSGIIRLLQKRFDGVFCRFSHIA